MDIEIPDIPSDLYTKFNDVTYYDEPHEYYVNGEKYTSVTTLIHKFQNEFDEEYWSSYISEKTGLSKSNVKLGWKHINEVGTIKGSTAHDYAENLFLNKVFPYPKQKVIDHFGYDAIWDQYLKTKNHIDNFYNATKNKLIPIKTELVVYYPKYKLAGMVDLLVWNVKEQEFQIWDYKTNKDFTYESEYGEHLNNCLSILQDCDLEIYSLQLSTYKHIIEQMTNVKIGKCYLVWVSHRNENFKIIQTKNREFYVKQMLEVFNG